MPEHFKVVCIPYKCSALPLSGTSFYGSNDPTNRVKALKEDTRLNYTKYNKTPKSILTKEYR